MEQRPIVDTVEKAHDILMNVWDHNRLEMIEQFKVLYLGTQTDLLGIANICDGGLDFCHPDPRIVFATALKARASGIILAHNHPSGVLKASQADINLTDEFVQAARLLKIHVLDHIILSKTACLSMASEGLVPK